MKFHMTRGHQYNGIENDRMEDCLPSMYEVKYDSSSTEYIIRPHLGRATTWWIGEDHSWSVAVKANLPMEAFEAALTFIYDKQIDSCLGVTWRKDFGQI